MKAALRRLLGIRSPSLEVLAGRVPTVDPALIFGADWRLSDAPATVRARRRRRTRRARRQSTLAAPITEALLGWLRPAERREEEKEGQSQKTS